jgi:alpha-glucuronidase
VLLRCVAWACLLVGAASAHAEDGYDLWLRYRPVEGTWAARYRSAATEVVGVPDTNPAAQELLRGVAGLVGVTPSVTSRVTRDGAIVLSAPGSAADLRPPPADLETLGGEGYLIRSIRVHGHRATLIAANSNIGVLYGAFGLLRLMQTRQPVDDLNLRESPRIPHRILDHWDNLDGTIERGYAGASIWDWQTLPDHLQPRYADYARACASIGINGAVLNNVNAEAASLTPQYLEKVAALARVFRPFGLKVYLSARFTAPIEIGGLQSADPLDEAVRTWWRNKVDEIYRFIPDFGGFLIKANSEGQPGPQDYHRTHADGANMLAAALAPHGGIVMWRAFVYSANEKEDRAKQAYDEFVPLDGKFDANVLLQVKNGAIDFQPREPGHPLFGAMPKTPLMLEVQITKEYLGFATHLVYLGPLYEEALRFDTYAKGAGSSIGKAIDGMAGVSNIGALRNWTGSQFNQANWYVFGRLAWNPELSSGAIAEEWVRMTFSNDSRFIAPTVAMMMGSREAAVDYMTPLGLAHLMAAGHHYGPGPWQSNGKRADWMPPYYHRADAHGIGADRSARGSNAVSQYAQPLAAQYNDPNLTPEKYLLWFHHLSWDYPMASGRTLWDELVIHYSRGVEYVREMRRTWATLAPYVDSERYAETAAFLAVQEREARWWRDACIAYFESLSKRPLPKGYAPPEHSLEEYESDAAPRPLLHDIFQDHAVLQRDQPVKVWGESRAGDRVSVSIDAKTVESRADAGGHWRALLPPMRAGGPYVLTVQTQSGASQSIRDILVGDVFLCSGQSNMELPVTRSENAASEIAASKNDRIRILTVAHATSPKPLAHFQAPVSWTAAGPESIGNFSAACYYFARELQKSVAVPLGLIHSAWGGSRIEPWISEPGLRKHGGFDSMLDLLRVYARDPKAGSDRFGELWETWWHAHASSTPWTEPGTGWSEVPLPMRNWKTWGMPELASHDGMVWFRRDVTLTAAQAAAAATLMLGGIDKVDETWVNGKPIGNSFGYGTERAYELPAGALRVGENSIVVNVASNCCAAGMYGPPEHMTLRFGAGEALPLGGRWRYQLVPESMGYPPRAPWQSVGGLTSIYNAMIAPLGSYGLRGALWYQGESNAEEAAPYQALLSALMGDWRRQFTADLPYLIVELPNFGKIPAAPTASDWANLREAQRRAVLTDPYAALAVTIDVGEPRQLHPPDKQSVGLRLARAARHLIYGEAVTASGPVPRSAVREGARVIVSFDGVEGSLVAYSSNRAMAFELCAAEQSSCRFVDAALESDRVVLDADGFGNAMRVRFCWGDAPICNLYDKSGLPAGPFEIAIQK